MSLLSVAFDTGQESTSGMHASTSATTAAGSDETLLARYRKGDSAAFEVLYQRHRQGLYRFLCGLAGQTELADEIYQETWLSLIRSESRLPTRPAGGFQPAPPPGPGGFDMRRLASRGGEDRLVQRRRRLLRRVGAEMRQHLLFGDARGMLLWVHTATSSASSRRSFCTA